jgi:hypothetical protein
LYLDYSTGILVFSPEQIIEGSTKLKLEQLEHSPDGYYIIVPTGILARLFFKPRQIFNISVSKEVISYDPYDKDFGYIGRE